MLHAPSTSIRAKTPLLTLSGISKGFPGVRALAGVALEIFPGEVTALIGENGAGKSTLVKILTGIYQPDAGTIRLGGAEVSFRAAHDAAAAGITAIHQETVLFDELSVAENIFLGHAPRSRFGLIDWPAMRRNAAALLDRIGARIAPETRLRDLGLASRHLVAIARALSVEARIVIMDEPTASLSHKEIAELYELIERLKAEGKAILFISHKFEEIFRISDRYCVFRDGECVGGGMTAETDHNELVRLMVGRSVDQIFPKTAAEIGAPVLSVSGYSHPTEFEDIGFELRRGEILGFYGLIGAGRSEIMQALFGITRASSGTLRIDGKAARIRTPAEAIAQGIVYVPEERGQQGTIAGLPIFQNITLPSLAKTSRAGFIRLAEEFALAREYTARLNLRAAALDRDVGTLSGGNQQKVVIAKWLATRPKIIILDEPTKGVDIGSKAAIHAFMSELAARGLSIIMVSSEIPEILGMSDRVIVMREGRIVASLPREGLGAEMLVRAAAGIREAA
ncbi:MULTISPECIES: sugar ABC transporter ATP-binding protein [Rhodomicrobium]|uniref:sugar ABC transporter ATP-binding protein n=1 Tax=Rhodomicrobium TaxID=1068 RepID=UPI000B4BD581|nr:MULTISPECIES: sugar ABC transporter ATP-binding protein [Rhodomicrobium]